MLLYTVKIKLFVLTEVSFVLDHLFLTLFDHMTEATNKKDIVDIDADTLDCFLMFLYSETLDNFQWNLTIKLLHAANKY